MSAPDRRLLFLECFLGNFLFSICMLYGVRLPGAVAAGVAMAGIPAAVALLLGAVLCEASYVVIGKRLTASLSPRRISALINLWGLALVTPLGLWQALQFDFSRPAPSVWALLVFYALAASMATVWLWMKGLQQVPAPRAGVFSVMLPVSAALVGVFALGEPFSALHALALGMALAGVLLATSGRVAPEPERPRAA